MSPQDPNAEQLNAALDAILAGTAPAEACAGLPEALRPLADAALRLDAVRGAGDPRPGFALGLEERLRADLRLRRPAEAVETNAPAPQSPSASSTWSARWRRGALVGGPLLLAAFGFFTLVERADPWDTLYPVKRSFEAARVLVAVTAADRAEAFLDLGWRRLQDIEALARLPIAAGGPSLGDLLSDLAAAYGLALANADQSGDPRIAFLAQSQIGSAFDNLRRLAQEIDPARADRLRQVQIVVRETPSGEREILTVVWVPAAELAAPVQALDVRSADLTPAAIAVGPISASARLWSTPAATSIGAPPGEPVVTPSTVVPPPPPSPTPPAPLPPAPPPPALPTTGVAPPTATLPPPTLAPATPAPTPTAAAPGKPGKPRPRPPTATPPPPPSPMPTEEPWLTATAAPTRATPGPAAASPTPDAPPSSEPSPTPGSMPPSSDPPGTP